MGPFSRRTFIGLVSGVAGALAMRTAFPERISAMASMAIEKYTVSLSPNVITSISLPVNAELVGVADYSDAVAQGSVATLLFAVPADPRVARTFRARFVAVGQPVAYDDAVEQPVAVSEQETGNALVQTYVIFEIL